MVRVPIRALRRLELEQAVYEAVKERGVRGLALEEVAKHARTAKGAIHHYFQSKQDLIESAARCANREFSQAACRIIKAAKSPSESLWGIIALNLDGEFFQPILARTDILVLAYGIRYEGVLRIYNANYARIGSNLTMALRQLAKPEDVRPIGDTIIAIVDGAWVLQASKEEEIATSTLRALADYFEDRCSTLRQHSHSVARPLSSIQANQ
jgi:TetR/AcrR family transcriptional regulator, transcriptional repressor of bet genes